MCVPCDWVTHANTGLDGHTQRVRAVLIIPHVVHPTSHVSSPAHTLYQMHSIRNNIVSPVTGLTTLVQGEPIVSNSFGDRPGWIDPSTSLHIVTQNVQGIKHVKDDAKL
jgi:hypothetical protein